MKSPVILDVVVRLAIKAAGVDHRYGKRRAVVRGARLRPSGRLQCLKSMVQKAQTVQKLATTVTSSGTRCGSCLSSRYDDKRRREQKKHTLGRYAQRLFPQQNGQRRALCICVPVSSHRTWVKINWPLNGPRSCSSGQVSRPPGSSGRAVEGATPTSKGA